MTHAELLDAVRFDLVQHTHGTVLELGRGRAKAFPQFISVRERADVPELGAPQLAIEVESFEDLADLHGDAFDAALVFDVETTPKLWAELGRVVKSGGNVTVAQLDGSLAFYELGDRPVPLPDPRVKAPGKSACVVRYGGIGDGLQAAAVFDTLKADGHRITVMCDRTTHDVLRCDPRVDDWLVQEKDQVPNPWLGAYWAHIDKRFDRFVNLSGLVEETLLAIPGRTLHRLPHDVRHALCNRNYLEFMAAANELPFAPEHRFFPSAEELGRVRELKAMADEVVNPGWVIGQSWNHAFLVVWSLSGSGPNKVYPHMDAVIARLLVETPNAVVFLVGDDASRILQVGWEEEPRVLSLAGELTVRETLALAQRADLVVGPETGVLNAVAFEHNAKIVFLSHSSEENLTKHWINTASLHGDVPCYPCHRIHNDFSSCREHVESRTAACMAGIDPAVVWGRVSKALDDWGAVRAIREAA